MRDAVMVSVVAYFYCTALIIVIGLFSRTLMITEDAGFKISYGLWEQCRTSLSNSKNSHCSLFDWPNEVKDSVAADRVRTVQAFGTMTFIGGVLILTSPVFSLLFLAGKVSSKVTVFCFLGTTIFMGFMGGITWLLMSVYFDDITHDDYIMGTSHGWGAYAFRVGVGMTSLCVPVTFACAFYGKNEVHPDKPRSSRDGGIAVV